MQQPEISIHPLIGRLRINTAFNSLWQKFLKIAKINSTTTNISFFLFLMKPSTLMKLFLFLLFLQRIFSIPTDTLLIVFLKYSQELRNFCGFDVVPDGSKFTHFKQDFLADLQSMLPGTCLPLNKILMPAGRECSYLIFILMAEYSIYPVCFWL